jgi:hypothetical protein
MYTDILYLKGLACCSNYVRSVIIHYNTSTPAILCNLDKWILTLIITLKDISTFKELCFDFVCYSQCSSYQYLHSNAIYCNFCTQTLIFETYLLACMHFYHDQHFYGWRTTFFCSPPINAIQTYPLYIVDNSNLL